MSKRDLDLDIKTTSSYIITPGVRIALELSRVQYVGSGSVWLKLPSGCLFPTGQRFRLVNPSEIVVHEMESHGIA
ncbi:MAG: hypothetical protein VST67_14935 [Nitrospirota bacterium]|nr:hypothetical protein [Nitrospirota bacterium]